ncbi:myoD family inhibitor domain-containing -like isoform X1 [Labeo rohita]|uniref:MyoD family inhibitor domain-containing-like isoform X1 n=1 Tax=Labeo rohita TaxID=84645 RepID=A0A498MY43_LABRO|nr:myoD family inhibitor domain-containing -like isoform X1 [Labeo rohita]
MHGAHIAESLRTFEKVLSGRHKRQTVILFQRERDLSAGLGDTFLLLAIKVEMGKESYLNIWLMSSETILPPEGPEGPKKQLQEETNPLLSKSTDKCNGCTDESSNAMETSRTPIPGDATSDGPNHMTENHTHDDLVRTQPQPLPQPATSLQHGIDGEAARQQNGLHTVLSNGHGTPHGVTQPPSTSPTSESRKHPSPVSHRVQRKLRSSLSVNSDSSRRSKISSTGSHKPGSTPEGM